MKNPFSNQSELYEIFNDECSCLDTKQIFVFNGDYLQTLAFLDGSDICLTKTIKKKIRKIGFKYYNHLECYIKLCCNDKKEFNDVIVTDIRNERNLMIERLIEWKIIKNTQ